MKTSDIPYTTSLYRAYATWAVFVALTIATTSSTLAQTVTLRSQPLRFTLPKGVASSNFCTLTIPVSGLANEGVDTINLAVTGVPGSGAAAVFLSTNNLTSNITYTATLILTNDATIATGDYDMAVVASGSANFRLPVPVQVAYFWSGSDYTNNVSTNWASPGNWMGGVAPGAADAVVFKDIGGTAAITTNIIVPSDATVASIRFSPETSGRRFNTMEILAGAKLSVTGSGLSFSMHRDSKTTAAQMDTKISGAGTLEVNNPAAQIGLLVDQQQNTTFDLRDLNNFVADVSRIGLGNHRLWPNIYTNGYSGEGSTPASSLPFRFVPLVWLAKTNVIKCSWTDPNNYIDPGIRDYAIEVGNDTAAGTTANIRFTLGLSNAFFIDSICWAHAGKGGGGNNFNFNATNSYALFRGIGGSRMSVWAQGDASGQAASGSNVRGTVVDFSNGQVDALIDRLFLGRGRTNSNGVTIQGTLTIGGAYLGSVFNVNTAILGYQDVLNLNPTPAQAISGPVGTINVNSNATLRVNGDLHLGYTTAPTTGFPNSPENCSGVLNINNSGTVMASNILAGGATKLSVNNNISVNNSGTLIVTNKLGASDARINNFTLANNAKVILHGVTVGQTNAHVRTLTAATPCNITVPSISGYTAGDVTISLISYVTTSPVITGLSITPPVGLFIKSIVNNTVNQTIDVTFTDRPPLVLVWRGNVNSNWSTNAADKNWVTQVGGLQTNFVDGDSVVFDDTATGSTTIEIDTVAPGQTAAAYGIVVNSTAKNYNFNSGNVIGSATIQKLGSSTLTVNATLATGVLLSQGTLTGVGSVGPTALQDGTTMTSFSGSISGGLSASNATVTVLGTVTGGLNLRAGSLVNDGTISGSFTVATNVTLNNTLLGTMNVNVPWTVPTNSTLINNGTIRHSGAPAGNNGLTVNGSLRGVGMISSHGTNAIADVRVTMGAGGNLTIGNSANEITNMTIAVRLDLQAGSTSTFDVDNSAFLNDKIILTDGFNSIGKVNFGNGNSAGGTLLINKTAGPSFNLATTLNLFDLTSNIPDNQNQALPGVIPAPAPGLVWNVSRVVTNLTIGVMGPTFMTNAINNGTNLVFEWPEAYRGWRLERQTNTLAVGLESPSTNWVNVANSFGGTNLYYPDTNDLSQFYFRSVQTISINPTNPPAVFYRLAYP